MVVVVLLLVLLLECRRTVVLLECRRIEYYFFGLMSLLGRRADTRKIDLSQCTNAAAPIIAAAASLTKNNSTKFPTNPLDNFVREKYWWCRKCQILR